MADRRLMFVHAHPDDESIETGATMARYAAEGAHVALVTCTRGELGEIIPPALAHLAADRQDRLGEYRARELAAACEALGVTDHRFLGGPGRWRDSGMMGLPANDDPRSFWQADVDEAAAALAAVMREVRPQVVVTYDERGFYGHPDHIQAHRVTMRAAELTARELAAGGSELAAGGSELAAGGGERAAGRELAAGGRRRAGRPAADPRQYARGGPVADAFPRWRAAKLYATAVPRSVLAEAIKLRGDSRAVRRFTEVPSVNRLPFGVPDEQVTTLIDGSAYLHAKIAAMRAHATQIAVEGAFFALSDMVGRRLSGHEYYTLLAVPPAPGASAGPVGAGPVGAGPVGAGPVGTRDLERDLFAGL